MEAPTDNKECENHVQSGGASGYSNTKGKQENKSFFSFFGDCKSWSLWRGDKDKSKKEERTKEEHGKDKEVVKQKKTKKKKKEKEKDKGKEHGKKKGKEMGEESYEEKDKRKTRKGVVSERALRALQETELGEQASTRGKSIGGDEVTKQVQDFLQSQQKVWAGERRSKQAEPQSQDLVGALERAVYKAFVEGRFAHQTLYWPEEADNKDCRQSEFTDSTSVATSDTFDSNSSMFNKTSARGQRGNSESKDVVSL